MGLWDTVSSFGWFWDFQTLPYTAYNPSVEQVRHAISIDEHRVAFPSNLVMKDGEPVMTKEIKQIWFPGVHSDVGGGYPDAEAGLSKIAFEWMVQELRDVGGIHFDDAVIDQILGKGGGKYSPPDPNAAKHETLSGFWHLMEWLPRRRWHKIEDDGAQVTTDRQPAPARKNKPLWVKRWVAPHLYRRRKIPSGAWMHPAVRERKGYAPKLPADCVDVVRFPGRGFLPAEKRRQSPQ